MRWSARSKRTGRFVQRASVVKRRQRQRRKERGGRKGKPTEWTTVTAVSRAVIPGTRPKPGLPYKGKRYVEVIEQRVYRGRLSARERKRLREEAFDRTADKVRAEIGRGRTTIVTSHVISGIEVSTRTQKRKPKDREVLDVRDSKPRGRGRPPKYRGRMKYDE